MKTENIMFSMEKTRSQIGNTKTYRYYCFLCDRTKLKVGM